MRLGSPARGASRRRPQGTCRRRGWSWPRRRPRGAADEGRASEEPGVGLQGGTCLPGRRRLRLRALWLRRRQLGGVAWRRLGRLRAGRSPSPPGRCLPEGSFRARQICTGKKKRKKEHEREKKYFRFRGVNLSEVSLLSSHFLFVVRAKRGLN